MAPITKPARTSLRGPYAPVPAGPRVTAIIPTRDRAQWLRRAIDSVLRQTFGDFELIVVDDGSIDDTGEVVASIADPRITYIRLSGTGQSRARNEGIARARGDWVAFLDDDDEWLPEKLEKQLALLPEMPGVGAVYGRMCVQTGDEFRTPKNLDRLPSGDVSSSMLKENMIVMPSVFMVRRDELVRVGGFDETLHWGEDRDLWLRLAQQGTPFIASTEPLIIYHTGHEGRLSKAWATATPSLARYERRWEALARALLPAEEVTVDRKKRRDWIERLNRKQLKRLVRSGRRGRAWSYVRTIAPSLATLPWLTPFVAQGLAIVTFGQYATRLPGMPRRRQDKAATSASSSTAKPLDELT